MTVYSKLHSRWYQKAKMRAMKHPTYAEIEQRRQTDRNTVIWLSEERNLGQAEWEVQDKIFDRTNPYPRYLRAMRWWRDSNVRPKNAINSARTFIERGRRGWAVPDTWSLDNYLAKVIADSVEHLRLHTHGYPTDLNAQEWDSILCKIRDGFRAWTQIANNFYEMNDEQTAAEQAKFNEGMTLFAEYFGNLWN